MNVTDIFSDDEAVSPVVSVILMVAITVILAAVIGVFALDLGNKSTEASPTVSISFKYTDGEDGVAPDVLNVTHESGDTVRADELYLKSDVPFNGTGPNPSVTEATSAAWDEFDKVGSPDSELTSGFSLNVESASEDGDSDFSVATVRVVWRDTRTDTSATLGTFEGPDA